MTNEIPDNATAGSAPAAGAATAVPFGVNEVRLSPRQWLAAVAILLGCAWAIPRFWPQIEPLATGPDDRIPYSLNEDYWLFQRRVEAIHDPQAVPVLGDSVMWGHYVLSRETLSAHLNRLSHSERFYNLGLDGVHPAALMGLVEHYTRAIAGRKVILHCNFLWMSSKRHDLQDKKARLNHPALVPQFSPRIPSYDEALSNRLGVVIRRQVPLLEWANHVQIAYFGHRDIPGWTLDHPYDNPLAAVTLRLPSPDEPPSPLPVAQPWTKTGMEKFNPPWVDLDTSFQWRCFRQTVEILQGRGNRVFVLVGPFNVYMLTDHSRQLYHGLLRQADAWLSEQQIPHRIATVLPSDDYADASHPLGEGYARLARQLLEDPAFGKVFLGEGE